MYTIISNKIIRKFAPCYDPSKVFKDESEELSIVEWTNKYRTRVDSGADIVWLLCRNEFLSDRDLRLFAVWCARESFKLVKNVGKRSINAVNVAEKFANGKCTELELESARKYVQIEARESAIKYVNEKYVGGLSEISWLSSESALHSTGISSVGAALFSSGWLTSASKACSASKSESWSLAELSSRASQVDKLITYFQQ